MNYEFIKGEREHQEGCPFSFGWWLKMWELVNDRWYDYNEIVIHTEFDEEINREATKKLYKYRELMDFIRERLWISSEEYLDYWMRRHGLEYDTSDPDKDLLIVNNLNRVILKGASTVSGAELAKDFHQWYEELAPEFGYETREETKELNFDTPNGKLMLAVCEYIINKYTFKEMSNEY